MGLGFRELRWNVNPNLSGGRKVIFSDDSRQLLMCSRYLNAEIDRLDYQPPIAKLELVQKRGALVASLAANDENGLRHVVFINENSKQKSIVAGRKLSGKSQTIEQRLPASMLQTGKAMVKVFVVDNGGNYARVTRSVGSN